VKCPHCNSTSIIKKVNRFCLSCGAEEIKIKGFEYLVWKLTNGRIVASPDATEAKKEQAKKDWPSGDWQ